MIDPRTPWSWIALAALQPILHLWLARRSRLPWFALYCYFFAAASLVWLWKAHDPYTHAWYVSVVPGALFRCFAAAEASYGLLYTLPLGSLRHRLSRSLCRKAALAAVMAVVFLYARTHDAHRLPAAIFLIQTAGRFWSITLVAIGVVDWLWKPHPVPPPAFQHAVMLGVYLLLQTVGNLSHNPTLDAWWLADSLQMIAQSGLLVVWISWSYAR